MGLKCLLVTVGVVFILSVSSVVAEPATLPFTSCFTGDPSHQVQISTVYGQTLSDGYLNFTIIGSTPIQIVSASNDTNEPVATTLFTTTDQLTFNVWDNGSYFCSTVRPQSPLPTLTMSDENGYCPLSPGPFAFSTVASLPDVYELATFNTRLRVLDPYQNEMLCIDIPVTPLKPSRASVYGHARVVLYGSAALAAAYWLLVGIARVVSAWNRGLPSPGIWRRIESAGFIFASALSGERLANSPALLRFCTPSLRDIIFHSQWCAALAMVAVRWPQFVYPLLSQTAWSMLSYNISITGSDPDDRYNPLTVQPYNPPSNFADQLNNISSPLFIDANAPNTFFMFPTNVTTGIPAFAAAVGIPPSRLFGATMALFLALCGAAILLSVIVWAVDHLATFIGRAVGYVRTPSGLGRHSGHFGSSAKDTADKSQSPVPQTDENRSLNSHLLLRGNRFNNTSRWRSISTGLESFHGSVLQGNLIRLLVLFHFPVTLMSCYQMTLMGQSPPATVALAAISFTFLSVAFPIFLIFRLYITNTSKLYDETWTLLALGPLYNHYRHGSQLFACLLFATNIAFGLTIGCGQKSGTAQAIIILVIEVVSALGTSFWLPWGHGASMGLISFLFCVARIVIAVLMVILAPIVSIGTGPDQWVAYAILIILGLVYLAFLLMLVVKLIEAFVRIFGGVGFHRSRHVVDSGLYGAWGLAGWFGSQPRRRPRRSGHHRRSGSGSGSSPPFHPGSSQLSLSKPGLQSLPTPTSSAPPSVLRPEHALQPYREESDDEDGYIMGAWHSYTKPGYSAVEDHTPGEQTPPQQSSGFMRVGGGRAHIDTPYAIQSSSRGSFERQTMPLRHPISSPEPDYNNIPPTSLRFAATSTSSTPDFLQVHTVNDNPPGPSGRGRRGSGSPPSPVIGRAAGRPNLPHGAMPPAHLRVQSQSAIVVDPGPVDTSNPPGPSGSHNSRNGIRMSNVPMNAPSPIRAPPVRYTSDDGAPDSPPTTHRKKPWFRGLRNKGQGDDGAPADEEFGVATGTNGGNGSGRSFQVVRKNQGQGQSPGKRPSTAGSSGGEDGGQKKGTFVVLRGRDAQSDEGYGGPS